ncbi:hydrolase [Hyphomicrobium sp. D-2]|uniref:hydrolase n=1 Tax=Hyphomicrobium sp. D-2 TaxID=3041621 RepID=UPI00245584B9|nr:hydrolase [Hyphomicrobium sp. D-2]MDH4981002.1 hydrolase [Hyphomicrobium sp. D-2]
MSNDRHIRTSLLRCGAVFTLLVAGLLCAAPAAHATETWFDPSQQKMPSGDGVFEVDSVSRGPVTIYTYRPQSASSASPIWVVMPGTRRDEHRHLAFDYYDTWRPLADQYGAILLVPEFTAEKWPGAWTYNMGNVRSPNLQAKPWRQTSFYVVEEAFRLASHSLGGHRQKFSMFGHGAGAQFIQRYVMHSGCRHIDRAVAANSGWYMMPESGFQFPFGLGGAPIGDATLGKAFGCNLTLLLGTSDVNYARMRNDRDALRQGKTRYERGRFFYRRSRDVAANMGASFNWRVREVPGVAHQADRMAPAGAAVLAGARVANSN